jgi:hypothetical protein
MNPALPWQKPGSIRGLYSVFAADASGVEGRTDLAG